MFHSLSYDVTFPTTGRRLKNDIDFEAGMGAISGPNEAGKSFVLEMLRFSLFGTAALRGKATDYKNLEVTCKFEVGRQIYKVERGGKAKLWRGTELVATSTTAVNEKILRTLGFGLPVFDVACAANQGDIEKLGAMRAGERKRLIDSVVGLNAIDKVTDWSNSEARTLRREAEAVSRTLVCPVEPVDPGGDEADILATIARIEALVPEKARLQTIVAQTRTEPKQPTCDVALPAAALRSLAEQRKDARLKLSELRGKLAELPDSVQYTEEQLREIEAGLARYNAWIAARDVLQKYPKPGFERAELERMKAQRWLFDTYLLIDEAQDNVDHLLKHDSETCPNCQHNWPRSEERLRLAKLTLAEMKERVGDEPRPEQPTFSELRIEQELRAVKAWEPHRDIWEAAMTVPEQPRPALDAVGVAAARKRNERFLLRGQVQVDLAAAEKVFAAMQDFEGMVARREAYESALAAWHPMRAEYNRWVEEVVVARAKLPAYDLVEKDLARTREILQIVRNYNRDLTLYQQAKEAYDYGKAKVSELDGEVAKYEAATEAMAIFRRLVKQHLLPSLNQVASALLANMTGGERRNIMVNDDFDIFVDGQPLETLSGSGKACANLALRLGLGNVLTNGIFSVFLGDEIDASMDANRASRSAAVLRVLADRIKQIVIVSHKEVEADYFIQIGERPVDLSAHN